MKYQEMLDTTEEARNLFELACETPDSDLEQNEAIQASLEQIQNDMQAELEPWANLVKNEMARAEFLRSEGIALQDRARTIERRARWFTSKIKNLLQAAGVEKVVSGLREITVVKNGGKRSIDIHDPSAVLENERYVMVKREVDKINLRLDLEAGKEVPGAILMDQGTRLNVK